MWFCVCGSCVGDCWEVAGRRRLRERTPLYNISYVSKAMLTGVAGAELAMCVFVCGFESGVGGAGRERRVFGAGRHGRDAGLNIWFLLLKTQKGRFRLLCRSDKRECTPARGGRL